ncbi:Rne/Rng family ribonuclease [Candidatus Sumerlaeota bacterium]|nr:Rne/Rng family ribonuclease [Candidatus Sumerlaeota bacterium]
MKKTLINVERHEVRIGILEDGELRQLFVEDPERRTLVGNIYKGRVNDVRPGIQAVFVDLGFSKNAFLHFDDVRIEAVNQCLPRKDKLTEKKIEEKLAAKNKNAPSAKSAKGRQRRSRGSSKFLSPADYLKKDMHVIVQVIKDPISTKGPRVTCNISLPGRYLVYLPYSTENGGGVSRKIENYKERRRLKQILNDISSDQEGFIIRTSGIDRSQDEISGDVTQLKKAWTNIKRKCSRAKDEGLLFNDQEMISRVVRDILQPDMDEIWIDDKATLKEVEQQVKLMIPELAKRVKLYESEIGLFDYHDAERQIVLALKRKVWLPSGGTLIFDENEAMTVIDVNTGKYTGKGNADKTILKTNLEAAEEIAHQLRLRDIGGLVVCDFIDMESNRDRKRLVERLTECMKSDRAKHMILSVNEFGLVAMTRKRARESLQKLYHRECQVCGGSGLVLKWGKIWRAIQREAALLFSQGKGPFSLRLNSRLKAYAEERQAEMLDVWKKKQRVELQILVLDSLLDDEFEIEYSTSGKGAKGREETAKILRFKAWDAGDHRIFRPHVERARQLAPYTASKEDSHRKYPEEPPEQQLKHPEEIGEHRELEDERWELAEEHLQWKEALGAPAAPEQQPAAPDAAPAAEAAGEAKPEVQEPPASKRRRRKRRSRSAREKQAPAAAEPAVETQAPIATEEPPTELSPELSSEPPLQEAQDEPLVAAPGEEAPSVEERPLTPEEKKKRRRGRRGGRRVRLARERREQAERASQQTAVNKEQTPPAAAPAPEDKKPGQPQPVIAAPEEKPARQEKKSVEEKSPKEQPSQRRRVKRRRVERKAPEAPKTQAAAPEHEPPKEASPEEAPAQNKTAKQAAKKSVKKSAKKKTAKKTYKKKTAPKKTGVKNKPAAKKKTAAPKTTKKSA